jgi:hypothetical protein
MKKNLLPEILLHFNTGKCLHFNRIMKLSVCLWLLFAGFIFAGNIDSQNVSISLNR